MAIELVLGAIRAPLFLPTGVNAVLFENQPMLWVAGGVVTVILLHLGRSRASRRFLMAGIACGAATLVWMAAAWLVVTPGERLYQAHQALAIAARDGDVETILSFLAADFRSSPLDVKDLKDAREQIEARLKAYGIKSNHITAYHVEFFPPNATTTITVVTESAGNPVIRTTWQLTWEDKEDWKIEAADLHSINDTPASMLPVAGH